GGMRQAGILAAAGLYALEHHVARLKDDHDNAAWLAAALRDIGVDVTRQDTNMVFLRLPEAQVATLGPWMRERGILVSPGPVTRLVTHLDTDRPALEQLVSQWQAFLATS
ncbi:MAG TPA: low-specificity L-threonine aldolase, partial [Erwinia persicina]|nr:low-specificity L-threonine aldolase [Erwinia persicina]